MASQAEARRHELARDRARERGRRHRPTIVALRLAELNRLALARYGAAMPTSPAATDLIAIIACHLAVACPGDPVRRINAWIDLRAPYMLPADREKIIAFATSKRFRWRADTLGRRLHVTDADRRRLRLRTIGAVDRTKAERAADARERKRLMDRERGRAKRRAAGATPRWLWRSQSLAHQRPWLEHGIGRRQWERRRQRAANETPALPSVDASIPSVGV